MDGDAQREELVASGEQKIEKITEPDFYLDELGRTVFTRAFHLRRGYCCESGCRHCPYGFKAGPADPASKKSFLLE